MNSASFPLVGKYTAIWAEIATPGMDRMKGSTDVEVVDRSVMNGESLDLHITIVPPTAFLESRGMSGHITSSLFRLKEYCPWKQAKLGGRSH